MPSRDVPEADGRSLTVLQVIPALGSGGAERTALELAEGLVRRGHRALVAAAGGRMAPDWAACGAEHLDLPLDSRNPVVAMASARALARAIRAHRVDLVHARSRMPAWAAWLACRETGTPLVTTYHGAYTEGSRLKRLYNSVMVRGAAVIAPSRYIASLIAARHSRGADRIAVVHDGIDLALFAPEAVGSDRVVALRRQWRLADGDKVVLAVARLSRIKGHRDLVEAMSQPPLAGRGDVVLVLAGGEDGRSGYRAELEQSARARGLEERVRLVGHCADVPAALALAEVAVQPSTVPEAFGRAAIEAQAMGVPTVVTALGAAPETVLAPPDVPAPARTGWHVPPGSPDRLAAAIAEALQLSNGDRQSLSQRARAHAAAFSVEAMVERTIEVYSRVLGSEAAER